MNIIGLMSGTSLDGLDIAFCRFTQHNGQWNFEIVNAETISYSAEWKKRLSMVENASALEFVKTDTDFGRFMGIHVRNFIEKHTLSVDLIASHGHTIFHQPQLGFTCQIGNGDCIVAETGIPVICNFRSLDVALGGQGAPLVPIGDKYLFCEYDFCLNLGGFANISYQEGENRIAFDVSPCNMPLNDLASLLQLEYDKDGEKAKQGNVDNNLLQTLNNLDYYKQPHPKSLGKEWFLTCFKPLVHESTISVYDKMRTITEHIAFQVASSVSDLQTGKMIVTGGGAFNSFLIERLQTLSKHTIIIPDKLTINYKEALIFAFLGLLRVNNENNCLPHVTGAKHACSGGNVMGFFKYYTKPLSRYFLYICKKKR